MKIHKIFSVEAARSLPNLPPGHPCKRVHGHSFKIKISVRGQVNKETGFVMDFSEIDKSFNYIYNLKYLGFKAEIDVFSANKFSKKYIVK